MASQSVNQFDDFESFVRKCRIYLTAIEKYRGNDPLATWYNYLLWLETNFVIDFKAESIFDEILAACLVHFENDQRYKQDRRLIKVFIKYIHFQEDPFRHYDAMITAGFGTQIADLYINWAYHLELSGNHAEADRVFKRGMAIGAKPSELLKSAHKEFGFSFAQTVLHESNAVLRTENELRLVKRFEEMSTLRFDQSISNVAKSSTLQTYDKAQLAQYCIPNGNGTPVKPINESIARSIIDSVEKVRSKRIAERLNRLQSSVKRLQAAVKHARQRRAFTSNRNERDGNNNVLNCGRAKQLTFAGGKAARKIARLKRETPTNPSNLVRLPNVRFNIFVDKRVNRPILPWDFSPKVLFLTDDDNKENMEDGLQIAAAAASNSAGRLTAKKSATSTPKASRKEYSFSYELLETTANFELMEGLCALSPIVCHATPVKRVAFTEVARK